VKWVPRIILTPCLFFNLQACYHLDNAYYLNNLYSSRRKIEEVLKDERTSDRIKKKLQTAIDILSYAKERGLNAEDKYTEYIDVGDRPISYIVEAAEVDQLKHVTWWFPVVGDVPYLGYMKKTERDEKANDLEGKGFDVYRSEAEAFSGLGWFRDPILSSYLSGNDASIANLLFHELTHATLWIPGSVEFNDNLASYIGDVLTIQYLESRKQAGELRSYSVKKADREIFAIWLQNLRGSLENLYSQRNRLSKDEILIHKRELFVSFLREKRPKFNSVDYIGRDTWNNAVVLAASLYISKAAEFAKARACLGNIGVGLFLKKIREANKKIADPFQILKSFCAKSGD
jgi:predicted aminopeptidase